MPESSEQSQTSREDWESWHRQTVAERHAFLLEQTGFLKVPHVIKAFQQVDRADFLPPQDTVHSMVDRPIPIGGEQANSQPSLVATMIQLLDAREGGRVLDIGVGSGWTPALLSRVVGDRGVVFGTERLKELAKVARTNIGKYGFKNVRIKATGDLRSWEAEGPFDGILVSANAAELPDELTSQLRDGAYIVIPVKDELVIAQREGDETKIIHRSPGVDFVPLVTK